MLRDDYPLGVPCWVDTFQPDPAVRRGLLLGGIRVGLRRAGRGRISDRPPGRAPRRRDRAGARGLTRVLVHLRAGRAGRFLVGAGRGRGRHGPGRAALGRRRRFDGRRQRSRGVAFALCDRLGAELVNEPERVGDGRAAHAGPGGGRRASTARCSAGSSSRCRCRLSLWRLPGYVGGAPGQPTPAGRRGGGDTRRPRPSHRTGRSTSGLDDVDARVRARGGAAAARS